MATRKQALPLLALDEEGSDMLQFVHGHMLATLSRFYNVKVVKNKAETQRLLSDSSVKIVVANDKEAAALVKSTGFLERGGTVVFAGTFSTSTSMPDFCSCFQQLGLPWKNGQYYRSDFFPTSAAQSRFKALPSSCNAKALLASSIAPEDRVYTPTERSMTQSLVFQSEPISSSGQAEAAVAFGKAGNGWVGYIGDVNGEEQTSHILLALLQWAERPQ